MVHVAGPGAAATPGTAAGAAGTAAGTPGTAAYSTHAADAAATVPGAAAGTPGTAAGTPGTAAYSTPAGPAAGLHAAHSTSNAAYPFFMDNRGWLRGQPRSRQRVIPRLCMGAKPNPHVPTGYTLLASLY